MQNSFGGAKLARQALATFALLTVVSQSSAADDSDTEWPDLSQLPPCSEVIHEATRDLSGLLSNLHLRVLRNEETAALESEHAVQPSQLAAHFDAFKQHQQASRRKPRDELLVLGLEFQSNFEKWICEDLSEPQRQWLFSQHIANNGYKGIDCGWLTIALEIEPKTLDGIRAAIQEAAQTMQPTKPRTVSRSSNEWPTYVQSLKQFFAKKKELENQLIFSVLNKKQQRFIRTAEKSARQ